MALTGALAALRDAAAALRGALGFLTRIPVGSDAAAWESFARSPWSLPAAGYLVGPLVALPLLAPVPAPTAALGFVAGIYALTGITHLDGVADLGDAAVVHGDADARREVLNDAALGVGGTVALALVVLALATAGLSLARIAGASPPAPVAGSSPAPSAAPAAAVAIVVVAEVGAKAATATLVCVGDAAHEGLGSALADGATSSDALAVLLVATPAALLARPAIGSAAPVLAAAAFAAAFATAAAFRRWSARRLGGISGDVLGATTELARVAALHAGVIAWTRF
ncbi:adenosylcobinamide-GDP ribazoletransferase [Halorubrum sp. BV1]|uniref:adenosylcobinamide-GDP ribazoletransferase n=1 Tax=Halorubrum sp. BV1 TaxID=1498500 RepID=UPI000B11813E|nr:adenosylcobinamide-GDP ribazoletransferase [Halorubrum sp. BV1]